MSVLVLIPLCFDYCSFEVLLKSERVMPSGSFFFLRIALAILGLLWFHIHFRVICYEDFLVGKRRCCLVGPASLYFHFKFVN